MICPCWVFVLAVVVVPLSEARLHKCEQRERSLANLDLVEDALNRAKLLVPNCEDKNDVSNSSECSRKDKALGFIDVALNLVADAKKNLPICQKEPPTIVTTEDPLTMFTTEELLTNVTAEELLTKVMTVEHLTNATTEEPETMFTTEKPLTNATPEITTKNIRPIDCQELQAAGHVTSGVYTLWPVIGKSFRVQCDMNTDGGGWTVIQRRRSFVLQENFDRDWQDYKNGFGNLERDFWLGNDNIFSLTNQGNYSLRMDMTAKDWSSAYALYLEFRIEDEDANYTLHLRRHSGTAGSNDMSSLSGTMFSTRDRKNINESSTNCSHERKGGFWYNNCFKCSPNGLYITGWASDFTSLCYYGFKGYEGLFNFEMKIKRL